MVVHHFLPRNAGRAYSRPVFHFGLPIAKKWFIPSRNRTRVAGMNQFARRTM